MNAPYKVFENHEEAQAYRATLPADEAAIAKCNAERKRRLDSEAESFNRCDTDGCVSQWVDSLGARKCETEAELAKYGGTDIFRCLLDLDGNLVSTIRQVVKSKFHYGHDRVWMVRRQGSNRVEWVNDVKRESTFNKKGLKTGWIVAPAKAEYGGSGHGLSGLATCHIITTLNKEAAGINV